MEIIFRNCQGCTKKALKKKQSCQALRSPSCGQSQHSLVRSTEHQDQEDQHPQERNVSTRNSKNEISTNEGIYENTFMPFCFFVP